MHYMQLVKAHEVFYRGENRALYYDEYMKYKDWQSWENPKLPIIEIMKLFGFIISWDSNFQGDLGKFVKIYGEIFPILHKLSQERIEDVDFETNGELKSIIQNIFNEVAKCPIKNRYESTDASKILHTILPKLFVMWDRKIRIGLLGDENRKYGEDYANSFLPRMQKEVNEAIQSCIAENNLTKEEAIRKICESCDDKTLPKLIDEFNYVRYTLNERI